MGNGIWNAMISLYAEVLSTLKSEEERLAKLESFDDTFGVDIPDWEERMKQELRSSGKDNAEDAIRAIDAFHAKYHVVDESGNKVFERIRMGNGYHQLVITYDANAPAGQEFSIKEIPDIEKMTLDELQAYYEELQSALDDLEDEEPEDASSEEHKDWENRYSDMEDLVDEVGERLEEMGGDV